MYTYIGGAIKIHRLVLTCTSEVTRFRLNMCLMNSLLCNSPLKNYIASSLMTAAPTYTHIHVMAELTVII